MANFPQTLVSTIQMNIFLNAFFSISPIHAGEITFFPNCPIMDELFLFLTFDSIGAMVGRSMLSQFWMNVCSYVLFAGMVDTEHRIGAGRGLWCGDTGDAGVVLTFADMIEQMSSEIRKRKLTSRGGAWRGLHPRGGQSSLGPFRLSSITTAGRMGGHRPQGWGWCWGRGGVCVSPRVKAREHPAHD